MRFIYVGIWIDKIIWAFEHGVEMLVGDQAGWLWGEVSCFLILFTSGA